MRTFWLKNNFWSHDRGLNPRPHPYHGCALPTELSRHESLLILTYLPRSRQATSGGGSSCWSSIRVLAGSALRTLPVAPRRYRLPSKLLRIRQQSSRPSGFVVHLGASVIRLESAQLKLLLDKLAVICGADPFGGPNYSATA